MPALKTPPLAENIYPNSLEYPNRVSEQVSLATCLFAFLIFHLHQFHVEYMLITRES